MNMNFIFNEKETQTIYNLVKAFDKNRKESKLYAGKVSESSNNIYFIIMWQKTPTSIGGG